MIQKGRKQKTKLAGIIIQDIHKSRKQKTKQNK